LSGLFERGAQETLMFGACPSLPTGFDFAAIRNVAFHETIRVFVIDLAYMIVAKLTNLAARCALASPTLAPLTAWGTTFRTSLHELFSSLLEC
jgi:hypothetical protein